MKNITHNNVDFWVESFEVKGAHETKTMYQAFYGDGYALSEIEEKEYTAICFAIKAINENF